MIRPAMVAAALSLQPAMAADLAFVTSQNANMVSVVDLTSGTILAEVPVEGAPAPVAYDPAHGRAYVISAETGRLSVLDESGVPLRQVEMGEGAFGIAAAADGGAFLTDWYGEKLIRLDADLKPLWTAPTGKAPAGVAVSQDGKLVATADRDDNRLSIFDASTGQLIAHVATGLHPYSVTWYEGRFWTADVQGDSVTVIDPAQAKAVGQVKTGSHPYGIAFAGGKGFVTDQYAGTVTVFDPESLTELSQIETGDYPEGIATLPDGSGVAVAHWDSNTLVLIDAASLEITREIEMPDGPRAFGLFTGRQR